MLLKVFIEPDSPLREKYIQHIEKHNRDVSVSQYPNAGFDLFVPPDTQINGENKTHFLNHQIKCAAFNSSTGQPSSYFLYPRSSISKTPYRLANSVGIIDSGYRGNIIAALDIIDSYQPFPEKIVQICAPNLESIHVTLVDSIDQLGFTERGEGGFGSTNTLV